MIVVQGQTKSFVSLRILIGNQGKKEGAREPPCFQVIGCKLSKLYKHMSCGFQFNDILSEKKKTTNPALNSFQKIDVI